MSEVVRRANRAGYTLSMPTYMSLESRVGHKPSYSTILGACSGLGIYDTELILKIRDKFRGIKDVIE